MRSPLDTAFESLARAFLIQHPEIPHVWRTVPSALWGERVDLICAPGAENEVFASLLGHQIAVGRLDGEHYDFEDFGRDVTDAEVAEEALQRFVAILVETGHLEPMA